MKILPALAIFLISGCAATGYQPGQITSLVTQYQLQYCATASPYQRAVSIALLQRWGVELPDSGVCTDLAEQVLAGQIGSVDTEQAQADREWAVEMLERTNGLSE